MLYKSIIRPLLFQVPPDIAHVLVANGAEAVSRIPLISHALRAYYQVNDPALRVNLGGLIFPNPIGLSAGFDKDGKFGHFAQTFGFGFTEIGSITGQPYAGNAGPWTRRLVRNESMVINYGLKSEGAERVWKRMRHLKLKIPFGISVAKTNDSACVGEAAIDDYGKVFDTFRDVGQYYTINLSCPNTPDGVPFSNPTFLEPLLSKLTIIRDRRNIRKPIFLKLNPDLDLTTYDAIITLAQRYNITGFVISNLFKNHAQAQAALQYPEDYNPTWPGSLSGKPVRNISTEKIRYVYAKTGGKMFIIGSGGIFTGDHAYEKIRAGASLVQLITGFIFNGPATIRMINKRLLKLLQRDGFTSISQAVGADHR